MAGVTEPEALRRLAGILARPEFNPPPLPPWERAWNAAVEWLADLLQRLLGEGAALTLIGLGWVEALVVLGALVAVAVLLVFIVRAAGLALSRDARLKAEAAARVRARSDALWAEGQALAAQGNLEGAARSLYLSALYALEEHDLVRVDEGQTNVEHARRAARAGHDLAATFDALVARYDRLRYGHFPAAREDVDAIGALAGATRAYRPAPAGAARGAPVAA